MNIPVSEPSPGLQTTTQPCDSNPALPCSSPGSGHSEPAQVLGTALQGPGREMSEETALIAGKKSKPQEVRKINERRRS